MLFDPFFIELFGLYKHGVFFFAAASKAYADCE